MKTRYLIVLFFIVLISSIILQQCIFGEYRKTPPTLTETIFSNENIKSIKIFTSKGYYSLYINKDSLGLYSSLDSLKSIINQYKQK